MDTLKKHLTSGEKILWQKKPMYRILNKYDLLSVPLTLLFFGGISFWFTLFLYTCYVNNSGSAFYFLTAGLLVYIISFYFIFGRFLYRKKRRSKELYVITNKRALILTELVYDELEEAALDKKNIKISGKSIYFGAPKSLSSALFYNLGADVFLKMRPERDFVFLNIDEPEKLLSEIFKEGENT